MLLMRVYQDTSLLVASLIREAGIPAAKVFLEQHSNSVS